MFHVIRDIAWLAPFRLRVEFDGGQSGVLHLEPLILGGGVFSRLSDSALRQQVKIDEGGRSLSWPGDIDLCADAIFERVISHLPVA
jgi:hypothetical protein